jgi:hypothetical protein
VTVSNPWSAPEVPAPPDAPASLWPAVRVGLATGAVASVVTWTTWCGLSVSGLILGLGVTVAAAVFAGIWLARTPGAFRAELPLVVGALNAAAQFVPTLLLLPVTAIATTTALDHDGIATGLTVATVVAAAGIVWSFVCGGAAAMATTVGFVADRRRQHGALFLGAGTTLIGGCGLLVVALVALIAALSLLGNVVSAHFDEILHEPPGAPGPG